jgi:hypothetical protein
MLPIGSTVKPVAEALSAIRSLAIPIEPAIYQTRSSCEIV